jgi:hypothetical protein
LIHTTFLAVALLAFISGRTALRPVTRIAMIAAVSVVIAMVGDAAFQEFGGRRVEIYLFDEANFTVFFLIGLLILLAYPLALAWTGDPRLAPTQSRATSLHVYLITYVGLLMYLILMFLVFPLGTYRIGYLAWLGLIPVMGNFDFGRLGRGRVSSLGAFVGFGVIMLYFGYQVAKAVAEDRYACLYIAQCASVLTR